jgi:non-ribosomal peptide synthetase component F
VSFEGLFMTYRKFDEASNRLAHLLSDYGVWAQGMWWRCCWSRSAQAIVAITAVLKAAAAYLPVDPAYPDARIGFVLDDAASAGLEGRRRAGQMPIELWRTERLRQR